MDTTISKFSVLKLLWSDSTIYAVLVGLRTIGIFLCLNHNLFGYIIIIWPDPTPPPRGSRDLKSIGDLNQHRRFELASAFASDTTSFYNNQTGFELQISSGSFQVLHSFFVLSSKWHWQSPT